MKGYPTLFRNPSGASSKVCSCSYRILYLLSNESNSYYHYYHHHGPDHHARAPRTRFTRRRCSVQGTFVHKRSWLYERARLPSARYAIRLSLSPFFFLRNPSRFSILNERLTGLRPALLPGSQPWIHSAAVVLVVSKNRIRDFVVSIFTPFARICRRMCQLTTECFDSTRSFVLLYLSRGFSIAWKPFFLYEFVTSYELNSIRGWIFANLFVWYWSTKYKCPERLFTLMIKNTD